MTVYEELQARGLIAQVTSEEEVSKLVNAGKATFYIGFDPTADSLHVGHFMWERSEKLAWFLTNTLGLKKGDRIAFCATNAVAFFDAYYVTFKTGIIITTYNCLLREKELFSLIENEDPKVIFYSAEFVFTIMEVFKSLPYRRVGVDVKI